MILLITFFLIITIRITATHVLSTSNTVQICPTMRGMPPGSVCICKRGEYFDGWMLSCRKRNLNLIFDIKYVKDKSITFRCGNAAPYSSSVLNQLNLPHIKAFTFQSCSLSNFTFYDIISNHGVEQLEIDLATGDKTFTESIFPNISQTITRLILTHNKIENLPERIFNNFPHLKFLSLSNNNIKTVPEEIFWKLSDLETLELNDNQLDNLPEDIFHKLLQLEELYLHGNKLQRLPKSLFQGLVNLKVLDLADNKLSSLQENAFFSLSQLVNIRLCGNMLRTLPEQLFNNTTSLRDISLSLNNFVEPLPEQLLFRLTSLENVSIHDCNLTRIHEDFFSRCRNITHLQLQNNGLSILPENIFRNNLKLVAINLNSNNINTLPEKLFPNQRYLQKLFLFKNNISFIPDGFFGSTRNLKCLILCKNQITNASRMLLRHLPNLEYIDLSINNLTHFSLDYNERIKYIDLSYNDLTELPLIDWHYHLELEELNLEHDKLTYLSIPVFHPLKRKPLLKFGYNDIKTVDIADVSSYEKQIQNRPAEEYKHYIGSTIYLYPNPFVCDCELYNFYSYSQKGNNLGKRLVEFDSVENLICQEPIELANKKINRLNGTEFMCNLEDGCSSLCKCYIRAKDGARVVDCSSRGLKTVPKLAPEFTNILYLQNNSISRIDELNDPIWENLSELHLNNNDLNSVDGWTPPSNLLYLSLCENNIQQLPLSFLNFTSRVDGFHMSLSKNPWSCNCSTAYFKKWLAQHFQIVDDVKNVMCSKDFLQNNTLIRVPLVTVPDDQICPADDWLYRVQFIAVTTICAVLALLLFIVSVLYYRNKQTVIAYVYIHFHSVFTCIFNEEDIDEDKIFDAFVSYSSSDKDVASKLVEELENKDPHFRLCTHERNWLPGNLISLNIINSVQNSRRTILVISKKFLESMWFQVEFHAAYYQMLEDKIDRLIIIVKGELPPKDTLDKDLQYLLSAKTYLVWEEKWLWERLKYAMPHRKQEVMTNDIVVIRDQANRAKVKIVEDEIALLSNAENMNFLKANDDVQN